MNCINLCAEYMGSYTFDIFLSIKCYVIIRASFLMMSYQIVSAVLSWEASGTAEVPAD